MTETTSLPHADYYETSIGSNKILKSDHLARVTVLMSVILKPKTIRKEVFVKNKISAIVFSKSDKRHFHGAVKCDMMLLDCRRVS